jgi:hypothetical protein
VVDDDDLVPGEEVRLTATGKISTKEIPATRYWLLHQDHFCSCAIRVARETLAVLPASRVVVHIELRRLDSSTGHRELETIISVNFDRAALARLNFDSIDPSDALSKFKTRMSFKKASGFESVEPISLDEQWVDA